MNNYLDIFSLKGKKVVITGGAGILGSVIAVSYTHLTLPTTPYV